MMEATGHIMANIDITIRNSNACAWLRSIWAKLVKWIPLLDQAAASIRVSSSEICEREGGREGRR